MVRLIAAAGSIVASPAYASVALLKPLEHKTLMQYIIIFENDDFECLQV